jgi:hypothetical protein
MTKQSVKISIAALLLAFACMGIYSCKKEDMVVPPARAFLLGPATANYQITGPGVVFKIPVGATDVQKVDRTVNINISSPTGAVAGTHYTAPSSVVIPAGKAVDTLVISAAYDQYISGRKDVLEVSIAGGVQAASFNTKVTVNVTGPCFEGDIVLDEMLGDYAQTYDGGYGPYTTSVVSATPIDATSARVVISNIFDWGWDDLEFVLDWSDPSNPKISFDPQPTGFDAGNLNSIVAGHEAWIAPPSNGDMGTYSYCDGTITINYRVCMPTYGGGVCFTNGYTTMMAR